jgi:hypothetical protein
MRALAAGLPLALVLLSCAAPTPASAVAVFDASVSVTLVVESTNALVLVQNASSSQSSGDSVTPGSDATATASAAANSTNLTMDLALGGQTGSIVPAVATAFADATLTFSLVNTDLTGGSTVRFLFGTTDGLLAVSAGAPSVESARLDTLLELEFVQVPGANVVISQTLETPPDVTLGPASGQLLLTEIIMFPASTLDISLHFRIDGEARAAAAVPEPAAAWLLIAGAALAGIAVLRSRSAANAEPFVYDPDADVTS